MFLPKSSRIGLGSVGKGLSCGGSSLPEASKIRASSSERILVTSTQDPVTIM